MLYPRDMNEKPQPFKLDTMMVIGGLATILTGTAGSSPLVFAFPISVFTFVLALLRIWIKPKPGQKFLSPGVWWGTVYSVIGAAITVAMLLSNDNLGIGKVVAMVAFLQMVVPGAIVAYLGYRRSIAHNNTRPAKPE